MKQSSNKVNTVADPVVFHKSRNFRRKNKE